MLTTCVLAVGLLSTSFAEEKVPRIVEYGNGSVTVDPDEGYVSAGVMSVAPTSTEALAKNSAVMKKIHEKLKGFGVEKHHIKTTEFALGDNFKTVMVPVEGKDPIAQTQKDGFFVSNQIRITVCKLEEFGKVLDSLVLNGATSINQISFGSSKAVENIDKARELAAKDALRKATILSKSLPFKLKRIISISESGNPPRAYDMYKERMPGGLSDASPVSGGSLIFSVTVSVEWEITDDSGNLLRD